jgi:hypothetical protein
LLLAGALALALVSPMASAQAGNSIVEKLNQLAISLNELITGVAGLDTGLRHLADPTVLATAPVLHAAGQGLGCTVTNVGPGTATVNIALMAANGVPAVAGNPPLPAGAAASVFGSVAVNTLAYCRFTADVPTSTLRAAMVQIKVPTFETIAITEAR